LFGSLDGFLIQAEGAIKRLKNPDFGDVSVRIDALSRSTALW